MLRFVEWDQNRQQWLKEQIQGALYTFERVRLPPGCTPDHARTGFEYTPQNGYKLYIDKGIRYSGNHTRFADLLEHGELCFDEFEEMFNFLDNLKHRQNIVLG